MNAKMFARMSTREFGPGMLHQGASQLGNGVGQALAIKSAGKAYSRGFSAIQFGIEG